MRLRKGKHAKEAKDCSSSVRCALFLLRRVASTDCLKPIRQKKFLFRWQKPFRRSDNWSQRRRHLKTDKDENDAPYSKMSSAGSTEKPAGRIDEPQSETDADYPKEQMQRAHENDRIGRLRKNPRHRRETD